MDLRKIAFNTLKNCLGVKENEEVLVVVDTPLRKIGEYFLEGAKELAKEAVLIEFTPRDNNGEEPPLTVANAMKDADVLLLISSKSLSHTKARHIANKNGARVASMPLITEDMMQRALDLDYEELKKLCDKYAEILSNGKDVHLTSENGTDLKFSIAGRKGNSDNGVLHKEGDFGNLPAGEAFIAPVEGTAEGTLVFDGSLSGVGLLDEPIVMDVEKGNVTKITGGESAKKLEEILEKYGEKARNIAELGIGLNKKAKLTGFILEDEKILGSCHIALGDNSTFGGKVAVDSHLDGIILKPTLVIDGEKIIEKGYLSVI